MACYGGLKGILSGLTKSTDHPSSGFIMDSKALFMVNIAVTI